MLVLLGLLVGHTDICVQPAAITITASQEEKISNLPIPELLSKTIDYLESFKTPTCEEHEYVDVDVEDLDSEKNYDFLKRNRID